MAAVERDVVNYYNLPTPYPEEWPAELDESDKSDDDSITINSPESPNLRRSKSRYSALERSTGERRSIPGSQRTGDGRDNLVQKDEQDPLGSADSVVRILRQRGLPVEDDARMRNRFLLSSTTFSPALFLSQTHSDASTSSLLQGLDHLSRSIDQKSASLKVLVESNFERFVRAKATIDTVYTEMRNQGDPAEGSRSLDVKRSSGHLRSYSSGRAPSPGLAASNAVPKKNALTKESEYGVKGIRTPLAEASAKAEEVWGPALSGRDLEQGLKAVMNAMDKQRGVYEVGANIMRFIKQRDYESVVAEYNRARNYANEAKTIGDEATNSNQPLTDEQIHTIIVTGRMWMDVEHQIEDFKRDLWRRLSNVQTTTPAMTVSGLVEEHMELIGVLLELGVDDNPVWVWLLSRYDFLKTKITTFCERSKVEIEILRRQLAHGDKPTPESVTPYLRLSTREGPGKNLNQRLDTEQVVEFWECIHTFLTKLLSVPNGILGDVVDFWEVAQAFINGTKQQFLPTGFQGESRKHHRLSSDGVKDLQDGVVELISLIRESVFSLFSDSPIEDISLLSSPLPQSNPATPLSGLTPTESRFKLDPKNLPPPSPQNGEPWEGFAFWPPYSNSISGVHYLSKFLILIGTGASDMTGMRPVASGSNTYDRLKSLVSGARERCVRAVCSAWNKDAENCKYLEDWRRDSDRRDLTKMPGLFVAFESAVLSGMQKILYISEAMSKSGTVDVVTPPPAKLLQMVRTQFVTSIYKALSGLVENAENPIKSEDDEWVVVDPSVASSGTDIASSGITADYIDAKNRNVRMLLTLSNLKALRTDMVPQLVTNFETSFSVKLTEESKTIRDVLGQIDSRLFQSYTRPTVETLNSTITNGIAADDWVPSNNRPDQVRPYVYTTMLTLVLVHTEVSTTIPTPIPSTSSSSSSTASLTTTILTHLLSSISSSLLTAFTSRPKYTLPALMQATLDTEFIAQTMSQYSSEEASQTQSQIYLELDRRTSNEARTRLQAELGEMRGVLKRLREGTKGEFACFKKSRSGGGSGSSGGGSAVQKGS